MAVARYLVTGGAGFVGARLVASLLAAGEWVCALDNLSNGSWNALGAVASDPRLRCVEGDVRDARFVADLVRGAEVVFHQAAICSVEASVTDPAGVDAHNVGGTVSVLDAARRASVRRVVIASSAAVYGDGGPAPLDERAPARPRSPYAVGKLAAEHYARVLAELGGADAVCLRYFNVFGPGQAPSSPYAGAISRFASAALAGEAVVIHGDGEQTRDFCYVDDVVAANILAASAPGRLLGCSVNIGTGTSMAIRRVVEEVGEIVGEPLSIRHDRARPSEVRHSRADVRLAAELLGFHTRTDFRDGLTATIDHLRRVRAAGGAGSVS